MSINLAWMLPYVLQAILARIAVLLYIKIKAYLTKSTRL